MATVSRILPLSDGTIRLEPLAARHLEGLAELGRDPDVQRFVGFAALVRIDQEAGEAEAGYIVSPHARGRGVAARALRLLTEWALGEQGLERLELRISPENLGSIRVAERCGFVREGVLRSVRFKQGTRSDLAVYSRLPSDAA